MKIKLIRQCLDAYQDKALGPDGFSLAFFLELLGHNQRRWEESFR